MCRSQHGVRSVEICAGSRGETSVHFIIGHVIYAARAAYPSTRHSGGIPYIASLVGGVISGVRLNMVLTLTFLDHFLNNFTS